VTRRESQFRPWRSHVAAIAFVALALVACFGESGSGRPIVELDFPRNVQRSSVHDAVLHIENPGPVEMSSVLVSFTWVGVAGRGLPTPIVNFAAKNQNPAVVEIEPEPDSVSRDGTVYRFGGLDEGEEMTITFTLEMPAQSGLAANAVTVYDGADIERAQGVRLATVVQR
jgi:hypothetical protein